MGTCSCHHLSLVLPFSIANRSNPIETAVLSLPAHLDIKLLLFVDSVEVHLANLSKGDLPEAWFYFNELKCSACARISKSCEIYPF